MRRARYYTLRVAAAAVMLTVIGFCLAGVSYAQHSHTMPRRAPQQARPARPPQANPSPQAMPSKAEPSLQTIHAQQLPAVQEAVGRAIQHLQAGHQQEALNEMRQVQASLAALHQALGKHVGPRFLNDRCPIMGAKINSDKVPAELTRVYGQGKVAFCCGGCPDLWDRLTTAEKAAKLKEVAAAPQPMHQGMQTQP